ncbi:unnamed protein product [Cladocopium goreaui]|uniref:ER lumen protein-retaining receptor 1 n=1 Tax=Cladocopium goreaui TaxID=2562237 RepID=A0A9P1FXM5_9DINO|nr:unnamed protein product [Cladocopium goreaui]
MDQAWIVAMDANTNQMAGTCATLMNEIKGCCRAHAGHNSSRFPIDGIWSSLDLRPTAAFSWQPGDGDHSLAEVHWEVQTQKPGRQQFRFAHTRKMAEQNFPSQQEAWALSCTSDERWTEVLSNVDQAWLVWCQDIETWLTRNGILDQGRPERPLGSAPRVQTSTHAMGPLQPLAERKLRRWIRRLQEARKFSHLGYQLNPGLQKKLESTRDVPAPEKQAVRQAAFGLAERLAHGRFAQILQTCENIGRWPTQVRPTAYRIWAAIRLQHCKSFVEGLLCQDQAGCNGLAAQDLLLTMENKYQAQDWPYAMALDLQKAFDTTDWTVTEEEQKRSDKVAQVARRIALLPTAKAFRNSVAVSVLAPTASWGALFNGRCPTKQECQAYAQTWRCAVQGFDHPGGHDSRDLTAVMAMGHCSDLLFLSTQRFMTALHKWALRPNQIAINSAPIKALQAAVQRLQGSWTPEVSTFVSPALAYNEVHRLGAI